MSYVVKFDRAGNAFDSLNGKGILAPIVLFTYNRPVHTRLTIEALQKNDLASESDLFIYADASKNAESAPAVAEVRDYLKNISGFKSVTVIERATNFGLAKSIIDGVTSLIARYERVIVLEDDLVTSPYFLSYMNSALEKYESDNRVVSIHGYVYPVEGDLPETFFLRGADCWGWATWKRGWDIFEPNSQKLLDALHAGGEIREFEFEGNYAYVKMLKQQIEGKVNSWAIRWYASAFLANKLTLYPGISLVQNIGNDNSGTHCGSTDALDVNIADKPVLIGDIKVVSNRLAYEKISRYFKSLQVPMYRRLASKIKSMIIGS